jgi:L-ascorbate metabolism protein UlaG (beta-lactamase superfamily)
MHIMWRKRDATTCTARGNGSATRITTVSGKVIVIDPFLTQNPKTPPQYKSLDALGKVDLILVVHAHGDHLGDGPELAKKNHAPLWGPAGLDQSLITLGVLPAELAPRMNKGGVITPLGPDIKITMTRAEHSSELVWKNPATGKDETHVGGEPGGFIIEFENGFKLYHMGDTGLFGDMKWIGEYYKARPHHGPDQRSLRDEPQGRRGWRPS